MNRMTLADLTFYYIARDVNLIVHDSYENNSRVLYRGRWDEMPCEFMNRIVFDIFPFDEETIAIYLL